MTVPLARAMSKLGLCSRREAIARILDGRVRVNGRRVTDPRHQVVPERARIAVDEAVASPVPWTTVALHKPRGVVTTRRDPQGRRTVYDLLDDVGTYIAPVGRLDFATSGLLLLTNDTRLGDWLLDPAHAVPRTYDVTVRGRLSQATADALTRGVIDRGEVLRAAAVRVRKPSGRETHVVLTLTEGRNREVRRLLAALGHEVTALRRVSFGGVALGRLAPGQWRALSRDDLRAAFPGAPLKAEG